MNWLIDFLFGSGDFVSAWGWLIPVAATAVGAIAGSQQARAEKGSQRMRQDMAYRGVDQMDFAAAAQLGQCHAQGAGRAHGDIVGQPAADR